MAIDLLAIQPHKVSRDLTGYITYLYGEAKSGKTTLASQAGTALILAFEKGYNCLPGVFAQDVGTWGEMKSIVRELKKPEVKARFTSIVIDTIDIAGTLCEKYVCSQNGVDKIAEIPYGGGWNLMKREFEDVCRTITQLGYALFFISHDKDKEFTRLDGSKYNQTIPTCPSYFNNIAKDMADIYGFTRKNFDGTVTLILRSADNSADCGCRFKYIDSEIEMSYQALVNAINRAIDKEAQLTNGQFVTNDRNTTSVVKTLDYDALLKEFNDLAVQLMTKDKEYFGPRITFIVDKYLGKGKKVSDSTIAQVEMIDQIVAEMKETLF